jgi:hypothetical protein
VLLRNEQLDLGEEEQYFQVIRHYISKHAAHLDEIQKQELWAECRFSVLNDDFLREAIREPSIPRQFLPEIVDERKVNPSVLLAAFQKKQQHEPRQNSLVRWSRTFFKKPSVEGVVVLSEDGLSLTHLTSSAGGNYHTTIGSNGISLNRRGQFYWEIELHSLPSEKFDFGIGFCVEDFPEADFLGNSRTDKPSFGFFFNADEKLWKHETSKLPALAGNIKFDLDSKFGVMLDCKKGRALITLFLNDEITKFEFRGIQTDAKLFPAISTVDAKTSLRATFHVKAPECIHYKSV